MDDLKTHPAIVPALGNGCRPVIIQAEREQFRDCLGCGVKSGAIDSPDQSGPIHWPKLSLKDMVIDAV